MKSKGKSRARKPLRSQFDSIEQALKDIKKGRFVILVDDEDRENEGDLVIAAEKVTPQAINFMAKHAPRPHLSGVDSRARRRVAPVAADA